MPLIPKSHPRARSLQVRERLVGGFHRGLVAVEGLLAEGRGEAFDYLMGEKTGRHARMAIRAAAARLLLADSPVISVNGNVAALCPDEVVKLAEIIGAKIEVNLFYSDEKRRYSVARTLKENGARYILGTNSRNMVRLSGIDSARRKVDKNGIFLADVVVVPLEDGDRTRALRKAGKKVITFDLNPMSRTARDAHITIVDNIVRAMGLLVKYCNKMSRKDARQLQSIAKEFDNKENLSGSILEIKNHLARRARIA